MDEIVKEPSRSGAETEVPADVGSACVGGAWEAEIEPQQVDQIDGAANGMRASVQVGKPVQPFDDQGQGDQQPVHQHAVGMVMADVLHAVGVPSSAFTSLSPGGVPSEANAYATRRGTRENDKSFRAGDRFQITGTTESKVLLTAG